jgi:hypothetical protein
VPGFTAAYLTSLCCLLALVVWALADPQYGSALLFARMDIGLEQADFGPPGVGASIRQEAHRWNALGPRIIAMFLLAVFGLTGLAVVVARMFIGQRLGRSVLGWVLAVCLVAAWLGFWQGYSRVEWIGLRLRAQRALPRFQAAAQPLLKVWPTLDGTLPEAGRFEVQPTKWPNTLFLKESPFYPVRTTFSTTVVRTAAGGLRFDLRDNPLTMIEYHPHGELPASHLIEHWPFPAKRELVEYTRLDESWYLAKYAMGH